MERATVLAELVRMERPVSEVAAKLRAFPWDCETELIIVTPGDFARVLRRYCEGQVTATETEDWANAIECRDDIGMASDCGVSLRDLLHELANPLLTEPLTQARAQHWLAELENAN